MMGLGDFACPLLTSAMKEYCRGYKGMSNGWLFSSANMALRNKWESGDAMYKESLFDCCLRPSVCDVAATARSPTQTS